MFDTHQHHDISAKKVSEIMEAAVKVAGSEARREVGIIIAKDRVAKSCGETLTTVTSEPPRLEPYYSEVKRI